MWYINYCSPFIYRDGTDPTTFRYIMFSCVLLLYLLYCVMILVYKIGGREQRQREKYRDQAQKTLGTDVVLPCHGEDYWMSQKNFKQWYLNYFNLHAISVGTCLLYSPYLAQVIFTILHLVLFVLSVTFVQYKKEKKFMRYLYNTFISLSCLMNVLLLFSGSMGVGASGYDENSKICLLQSAEL